MAARRRSLVRIVLAWAFLTLAWCAFVIVLAGRLHAQTPGCYVIDRFGQLCIPSTGEIFVHEAQTERDEYQQWIHHNRPSCCDHRDCAPASVEWTPHGWKVAGADNLVAEKLVIAWPFSIPYACIINRFARCLFLNNGG